VDILYNQNDNLIELIGLQDATTEAYENAATVTVTLKDPDGTTVTGVDGLSMAYVAASDGDYRGTIPYTSVLVSGKLYTAEVTADAGVGKRAFFVLPLKVLTRTGEEAS